MNKFFSENIKEVSDYISFKTEKLNNGCWQWRGADFARDYGCFNFKGKKGLAHRIVYEIYRGPIQAGLVIDHLCRNTKCVNPFHLEQVTQRINSLRGIGVSAINIRKTHCPSGHAYDEINTYIRVSGNRGCRTCLREQKKKYKKSIKGKLSSKRYRENFNELHKKI